MRGGPAELTVWMETQFWHQRACWLCVGKAQRRSSVSKQADDWSGTGTTGQAWKVTRPDAPGAQPQENRESK